MAAPPGRPLRRGNAAGGDKANVTKSLNAKVQHTVARLEEATQIRLLEPLKQQQELMSERMARDAEALFGRGDPEGSGQLSRGSCTEILEFIGLREPLEESFSATARLAFDAHSADSHFMSLHEFKALYCRLSHQYPELLPRTPPLRIRILRASNLKAADVNGKSDPFCTVQVRGKPKSKSQTCTIDRTLDPKWDDAEFDDKFLWEDGDALEFVVRDYDPGVPPAKCEFLGRATLQSTDFYLPGGFLGELPLVDGKGTLTVQVTPNNLVTSPPPPRRSLSQVAGVVRSAVAVSLEPSFRAAGVPAGSMAWGSPESSASLASR